MLCWERNFKHFKYMHSFIWNYIIYTVYNVINGKIIKNALEELSVADLQSVQSPLQGVLGRFSGVSDWRVISLCPGDHEHMDNGAWSTLNRKVKDPWYDRNQGGQVSCPGIYSFLDGGSTFSEILGLGLQHGHCLQYFECADLVGRYA